MSTQAVGTYKLNSFWESGRLIYYEKASGHTTTGNVFIVGQDYVQVGDTANDVDFVWKGTTTGTFILDAADHTLTMTGVDVSITGDLTIVTEDINLPDDSDLEFGSSQDAVMRWSTGDDSNHSFVIGLDNTGQQMHITDKGAVATDWARNTGTHPEIAIHSNTTPITDYLAIGNHDGTTAYIDVVGGSSLSLNIAGTASVIIGAASIDIATAASDIVVKANTAAALEIYDSTTKTLAVDTRNTVTGITNFRFTAMPSTITAAAGVTKVTIGITPGTTTLTGSTGVDNMAGLGLSIAQPTLTDANAVTIAKASTVYIAAAPVQAGSVTLTAGYALEIAAGDFLTAGKVSVSETTDSTSGTTGAINTLGGVGITKALWVGTTVTAIGGVVIAPTAIGTKLDFQLETEWVSGTLIDADFGGATTLTNDTIGFDMDLNGNVTMTTDKDVTAYQIKLPTLTQSAANTTTIFGITLPTAGALVQDTAGGTINWGGLNIQMPNITQTTGTVLSRGIQITSGTVTSGTQIGIQLGVDDTGVDAIFYGATSGNYMHWDESADDLLLVGTATQLAVAGTTVSSSTTTGSLRTAGGLGVAGAAWIGNGVNVTATSVHATTGRVGKFTGTVADPNQGDGYGVFEVDITASGTFAGTTNASSTWLNVAASAVPGGNLICVHNDGIYLPAGITASSATMIMGSRMQYVADDGANPGSLYLWSTNIYDNVLTAMLHVNTIVDLGGSTGAVTTNAYKVPLFKDVTANKVWYVNVYDG